jgi:chitinase
MSKHMPLEQINLGTPFYGYEYTNVTAPFQECPNAPYTPDGACDDAVTTWVYKSLKPLINQQGWKTSYDPIALVPYMLRADGSPGFITYDDAFSTYARVYYADWTRGIGGTFMWALDQDYDGHSQDLLDAMYHASLQPK